MITSDDPQRHLDDMVAEVVASGCTRRADVERALRTEPRHPFIPEADAVAAHDAHRAFVTKRAEDGASLSSASAPTIVALMLDQLDVQPGHRVLEIGAGTGYNAALLDHLAGDDGQVVTVDIDPDAIHRARAALDTTGHPRVEVITGDGTVGAPDHGMFGRIVITAGAWDVPPAWNRPARPRRPPRRPAPLARPYPLHRFHPPPRPGAPTLRLDRRLRVHPHDHRRRR